MLQLTGGHTFKTKMDTDAATKEIRWYMCITPPQIRCKMRN